jgi:hypothetical protein
VQQSVLCEGHSFLIAAATTATMQMQGIVLGPEISAESGGVGRPAERTSSLGNSAAPIPDIASRRSSFIHITLLFHHFLSAAAARSKIAAFPRCGSFCDFDFATAFAVRTTVDFGFPECHVTPPSSSDCDSRSAFR